MDTFFLSATLVFVIIEIVCNNSIRKNLEERFPDGIVPSEICPSNWGMYLLLLLTIVNFLKSIFS